MPVAHPAGNRGSIDTEGTSFSAPYIAGVVALMVKANPLLEADTAEAILKDAAIDVPGTDRDGAGVVDVVRAVEQSRIAAHRRHAESLATP